MELAQNCLLLRFGLFELDNMYLLFYVSLVQQASEIEENINYIKINKRLTKFLSRERDDYYYCPLSHLRTLLE